MGLTRTKTTGKEAKQLSTINNRSSPFNSHVNACEITKTTSSVKTFQSFVAVELARMTLHFGQLSEHMCSCVCV